MLLVILFNNEHIHTYIIVFLQWLFACGFVYSMCDPIADCLHAYIVQLFPYYIIDHIVWITMTTKFVVGQ